jgi:hypothetical protein
MVVALTATAATLGLLGIFVVFFPLLVNGLLVLIGAELLNEKAANDAYRATHRVPGANPPRVD